MATRTNNLKLSKAETSDAIRSTLTANNNNFDKLDDVITRLRANQISGTASGTEIEVADSANMESVLKVSGNSVQEMRSGKNKLQDTKKVNVESNGITFTYNANGTYTVNGTNNGNYNSALYLNSSLTLPAGTYYIIPFGVSTYTLTLYDGQNYIDLKDSAPSFTITQETTFVQVYFQIPKGTSGISNFIFYPMLATEPITKEDYELYGASPSPEFESPIKSLKSKSDNLFDMDDALVTKAEFVKQSDGSYYRATPKVYDSIWENTEGYTGKMSFTGECKWMNDVSGRGMFFIVHYTDGTTTDFMTNSGVWNKKWGKFELVTEDGKVVQKISTSWGGGRETYFKNIMLNKGTVALPYQPYGYVPAEAKVEGKNKLDLATSELGVTAPTSIGDYTRYTIINPNKLVVESLGTWNRVKCTIKDLKPNVSYTISSLIDNPNGANCGFYASSADTLYTNTAKSFKASITKNTNDNGELYFEFYTNWSDTSVTSTITYDEIQVEEGSTVSNFIASSKKVLVPLGDIELRSTPDTRDTFARVDGAWNVVSNVGSVILDGSSDETIRISEYYTTENYTNFTFVYVKGYYREAACQGYSNLSPVTTSASNLEKDIQTLYFGNSTNREVFVHIPKTIATTVDEVRTWLASHPMQLVFPAKTVVYTPITDQGLISALDELEQLILHKGYNRITVTGVNGVKAYLDLNYYKDINIVLDNINAKLGGV